jgi:hypothetical protein
MGGEQQNAGGSLNPNENSFVKGVHYATKIFDGPATFFKGTFILFLNQNIFSLCLYIKLILLF